jgi:hypothetical protein
MPLNTPSLDNRDYTEILRDALARIPVHNPEWTNFNDSDPGVTLLQLFAFMTENILYRANQIPERNRYKFLELLGIKLKPAAAAKGFVTINNERGPLKCLTLLDKIDVRAGQVRFRTTKGLDVLPIEAQVFYKKKLPQTTPDQLERAQRYADLYRELYADQMAENNGQLVLYETAPLPLPTSDGKLPVVDLSETVDQCLWIALLFRQGDTNLEEVREEVRAEIANKILTIGAMPHLEDEGIVVEAGQTARVEKRVPVSWAIAKVVQNGTEPSPAFYEPVPPITEDSILKAPGLVQLKLPGKEELKTWNWDEMEAVTEGTGEYPPSLADTTLRDRVITWIRLRVGNPDSKATVRARLSWIGINATMVQQQIPVIGEVVGTGTGEPDQQFRLANRNILPDDTLQLTVNKESWQRIDDILAADPEVPINSPRLPLYQSEITPGLTAETSIRPKAVLRNKVFILDPESGEIRFGDGAHGARPRGEIVANYVYGGGRQGNVGMGLIDRSPQLPAGYKVTNPLRTWGGEDAQDIASAEKTIPRTLQHRDRLVSLQDFEDITRQTPGVEIGRVEVIPLFDPSLQDMLGSYFTAQTQLIGQLQVTRQRLYDLSSGNPQLDEVKKRLDDLDKLLQTTNTLWGNQNDLITKAINKESTSEPFRQLQQLFRQYTTNEIPGAVTVLVIPANPDFRSTPQPDQFFLEAISDHLCPRRLVTTELHIRGPVYQNIWLSVAIKVLGGYAIGPVREAVKQALFQFLSPLYGWHRKQGWPLKVAVTPKELEAIVARVDGVRAVAELRLGTQAEGDPQSAIRSVPEIAMSGLMLPRLVNVEVAVVALGMPGADAETSTGEVIIPLENLRQSSGVVPEDQKPLTPIPVLPERC